MYKPWSCSLTGTPEWTIPFVWIRKVRAITRYMHRRRHIVSSKSYRRVDDSDNFLLMDFQGRSVDWSIAHWNNVHGYTRRNLKQTGCDRV